MCKLSILVPGIRNYNWVALYDSIDKAMSDSWELILVGPHLLPQELCDKKNVQYIQDFGSPVRCRQIGLNKVKGDWTFHAGDDVLFLPNVFDIVFDKINLLNINDRTVILAKYTEGKKDNPEMLSDEYWTFQYHDSTRNIQNCTPYKAWIIMTGLIQTKLLKEIGGFDCQFNVCAVALLDLSLRLQNYGIDLIIHDDPFFHADHLPGKTGDHSPVSDSQLYYDMPLLHHLYTNKYAPKRTVISLNNWKYSPQVWLTRFTK